MTSSPESSPQPSAQSSSQPNPLQQLRDVLPGLSGATRRVAELVLEDPEQASSESITGLAERAGTSPATLTRLAGALGFAGFPAWRSAIATEHGRRVQADWESDIGSAITPDDTPGQVLNTLAATQSAALRNALTTVDLDAVARVAQAIADAGRVALYGEWGDSVPAHELSLRLLRIGVPVWHHRGPQEAQVVSRLVAAGDVALAVARSGVDQTTVQFLTECRAQGALTVVITGEADSAAGAAAEITLATGTRNGATWTEFFAGRASDTLVAGLLFVLVAQHLADRVAVLNPFGPEVVPVPSGADRPVVRRARAPRRKPRDED